MHKDYIQDFPKWWEDINYYDLVLSNDLDSLWSCTLLEKIKGWKINYFYNFNNIYRTKDTTSKAIGVDIDLAKGRCFSNHVTMMVEEDIYNKSAINFNIVDRTNRNNYYEKYCGSTVLMLYSLYNFPLPDTDLGKMILLAVDSTYLGYYLPYKECREANKYYICHAMGFEELYELLGRYNVDDFEQVIDKYKLKENIYMKDNKLQTNLLLNELSEVLGLPFFMPKNDFLNYRQLEYRTAKLPNTDFTLAKINKQIFSLAITRKNEVKYTIKK